MQPAQGLKDLGRDRGPLCASGIGEVPVDVCENGESENKGGHSHVFCSDGEEAVQILSAFLDRVCPGALEQLVCRGGVVDQYRANGVWRFACEHVSLEYGDQRLVLLVNLAIEDLATQWTARRVLEPRAHAPSAERVSAVAVESEDVGVLGVHADAAAISECQECTGCGRLQHLHEILLEGEQHLVWCGRVSLSLGTVGKIAMSVVCKMWSVVIVGESERGVGWRWCVSIVYCSPVAPKQRL